MLPQKFLLIDEFGEEHFWIDFETCDHQAIIDMAGYVRVGCKPYQWTGLTDRLGKEIYFGDYLIERADSYILGHLARASFAETSLYLKSLGCHSMPTEGLIKDYFYRIGNARTSKADLDKNLKALVTLEMVNRVHISELFNTFNEIAGLV